MTTARKENESFEDYKVRQKEDAIALKAFKQGTLFWDSYYQGTYINHEKQAARKLKAQKGN
jgi:hypothetical protein